MDSCVTADVPIDVEYVCKEVPDDGAVKENSYDCGESCAVKKKRYDDDLIIVESEDDEHSSGTDPKKQMIVEEPKADLEQRMDEIPRYDSHEGSEPTISESNLENCDKGVDNQVTLCNVGYQLVKKSPQKCRADGTSLSLAECTELSKRTSEECDLKSFTCDTCGKKFLDRRQIVKHIQIHHVVLKPKPYKCGTCAKTFSFYRELFDHTSMHLDKRPYVCNICGKSFTLRTNLSRHVQVHLTKRS